MSNLKSRVSAVETDVADIKNDLVNTKVTLSDKFQKQIDEIKSNNITELKTQINDMTNDMQIMKNEISKFNSKDKEVPSNSWAEIVSKEVDNRLMSVNNEVSKVMESITEVKKLSEDEKDRESRSHNIIIYRVKEDNTPNNDQMDSDRKYCLELFNMAIGVNVQDSDLKAVYRLGKKCDQNNESTVPDPKKHRPLMVKFKEKTIKNLVMESVSKLRNAELYFKNVSISHDLTLTDRNECKKLLAEAKEKEEQETGEFVWRVRGQPGSLKLLKLKKRSE